MDKLMEKLKEYGEKFGDRFPMIPVGWGRTDEEIVKMIQACIDKGKDAYEIGYVKDDDGLMY